MSVLSSVMKPIKTRIFFKRIGYILILSIQMPFQLVLLGCSDRELSVNINSVKHPEFTSPEGWSFYPEGPFRGANGDEGLGVYIQPKAGRAVMSVRHYKWPNDPREPSIGKLSAEIRISEPVSQVFISHEIQYAANPPVGYGAFSLKITVSKDAFGDISVYEKEYTEESLKIGSSATAIGEPVLLENGNLWAGQLYVTATLMAWASDLREFSHPQMYVEYFDVSVPGGQ